MCKARFMADSNVCVILPGGDYIDTQFLFNRALGSLHSLNSAYKKPSQPHVPINVLTEMSVMTDSRMLIEAFRSERQP